jgi:hypothetical protein
VTAAPPPAVLQHQCGRTRADGALDIRIYSKGFGQIDTLDVPLLDRPKSDSCFAMGTASAGQAVLSCSSTSGLPVRSSGTTFRKPRRCVRALALLAVIAMTVELRAADSPETEPTPPEAPITASDRMHWAFQPARRPTVPPVQNADWCRTAIDRFILPRLETTGLSPLPEADRATLLRRVTFDLTGLPPTVDELDAFLADPAPDAYDRVVDRLLASPAYGERWAQHWLDLARFAETDGFEFDHERPNAWRYRDWVVDSLNGDMPFDQFIRLQLAADELHPDDAAALAATGFLLCGPDMPDINDQQERRSTFLNDLTGTVSAALFGLQVGCAQCHDHKYDPISQYDFYRLRAFFDGLDLFTDHPLPGQEAPPVSPEVREGLAKLEAAKQSLTAIEESARQKLRTENPDLQPTAADLLNALSEDGRQQFSALSKTISTLQKSVKLPDVPRGRIARELADVKPSHLLIRGDFRREGPVVTSDFPRVANAGSATFSRENVTTGRRSQLAVWLMRDDHPLTGRVIVNRLWQHHFGRGLVETASDFGLMGNQPTHPELLDWLATELPRRQWRLKEFHKLLVTSAVYRQASRLDVPGWTADEASRADGSWNRAKEADPENQLLSHMPRQRLDGEAIRDAMLAVAGRLNREPGGPGVRPPLPAELVATLLKNQWNVSPTESDHRRRSLYLFVRRNLRYPLFEAFDRPDTNASCTRRNRSTTAPQALVLLNSEFSLTAARDLAGVLIESGGSPGDQIHIAYRRMLGRDPTADEQRTAEVFLDAQAERLRESKRPTTELALPNPPSSGSLSPAPSLADAYADAALCDFCLALFNLNEFVYVD